MHRFGLLLLGAALLIAIGCGEATKTVEKTNPPPPMDEAQVAPPKKDAADADADAAPTEDPFAVGNVAPDIDGIDLDGEAFKLSDYRGKVVMLDFWGDW